MQTSRHRDVRTSRRSSKRLSTVQLHRQKQKHPDETLRHRSEQFQALLENVPLAAFAVDADFMISHVNRVARPLFVNVPHLIGRDFDEVMHVIWPKRHADDLARIFRHTLETGEPYETSECVEHRADQDVTESYEWRVGRVPLPDGRLGVISFGRDITKRIRTFDALHRAIECHQQQVRLFDGIASATPDFVYVFDREGRLRYANRRLLEVWGMKLTDIIGKTPRQLGYEQQHQELNTREIAEILETRRPLKSEIAFKSPLTGIFGIYEYILSPVLDPDGEVEFIAGTARDVTERKRAEEALQEAQGKLREYANNLEATVQQRTAELQKTVNELEHFSYSITHDMRAPLRAMHSFSSLLLDDFAQTLPSPARDFLKRIAVSADRMDHLITDALDYSKAVREELKLVPVDAEKLLCGMIASYPAFQPPAARIGIVGELPGVLANHAGLTQCFSNLLDNAVKFIEPGRQPQVRVWAEKRGAMVRLWFEDNGIGIPPEMHERIFGMFQRLSRDYEGTGIGLALVRKVMERMGGSVGVESEAGGGSRFWLELRPANGAG